MDAIKNLLERSVDEVIVKESLESRLNSNKKLVVKLGIDPTGSELHLGHAVVLRKLREFQNLGHQVVLVIGDFTAKIGDPSGRTKERKTLTDKQIKENMKTYREQASKILDISETRIVYNSEWLGKFKVPDLLELASKATLAQVLERKELKERLKQDEDVLYLEPFYPLMQGYDSVALKADVELGGTDQRFNLLMGRQVQKRYGQIEQDVVILKLLTGTDGQKMSKSANNYIPLTTNANDMYGKIMSLPDELITQYTELCTELDIDAEKIKTHPFESKKELSKEITKIYHGEALASKAEKDFVSVFKKGEYKEGLFIESSLPPGSYKPTEVAINSGATTSTVQAKEMFRGNAIQLNEKPIEISSWTNKIDLKSGDVLKIGKRRIVRIK